MTRPCAGCPSAKCFTLARLRLAGYDTTFHGKWHLSHADLHDTDTGGSLATNDDAGDVDEAAVQAYLDVNRSTATASPTGSARNPTAAAGRKSGLRRDPLTAARAVSWLATGTHVGAWVTPPRGDRSSWWRAS